ncbi:MAG: helix-turn-helix domain-containing protein [Lactococcus garvieae]
MARLSKEKAVETAERFEKLKKELLTSSKQFRDDFAFDEARISLAMELLNQRKEAGLLQEQLAELAGKDQATIARIETMKVNPTLKVISEIAMAMNKKIVITFEDVDLSEREITRN